MRPLKLLKNTLLLVPCSGKKSKGDEPSSARSILSMLESSHAAALENARSKLHEGACVDERTLMPAHRRYTGHLYEHASESIGSPAAKGWHILIVSGGYGLLLADEPIGWYDKQFSTSDWPSGLLEKCILDYVHRKRIKSVIGVMSRTTGYADLIKNVGWKENGVTATLVSPVSQGKGAMAKVPRAQGQAIRCLIDEGLRDDWKSSDSLPLQYKAL